MEDDKRRWLLARRELVQAMESLGFKAELGEAIAKNLGSPKAMNRMTAYLANEKPRKEELVVDEMLAICSDIAAWRAKKESEAANISYTEYLNSSQRFDDEESSGEEEGATLSFESFDGGGPTYHLVFDDSELVSCTSKRKYAKADHEEMTGAGYTVTYRFTGKKAGTTNLTVEERSPIGDNVDWHYKVVVDENLHVEIYE